MPLSDAPKYPKKSGFRLGIYVCKDAEIVDYAAPHGVFSVARRFDPDLDAFLIADALRPVQTQAGFTVLPNYGFNDAPDMDAFLIPSTRSCTSPMYFRFLPFSLRWIYRCFACPNCHHGSRRFCAFGAVVQERQIH